MMTRTDWDTYYVKPYPTAILSRKITGRILLGLIRKFGPRGSPGLRIMELGGANSCFFDMIQENIKPFEYHIIDNNQKGLDMFQERIGMNSSVFFHNEDVLDLDLSKEMDLVFSVGLIEHFPPNDTEKAIEAHFRLLVPGGIAIISFPTPTFLYRITRRLSEAMGMWIFHDERPLKKEEVIQTLSKHGTLMFGKTIWPIFLTQYITVGRRSG